jgi:hypothetical protein
MTVCVAAMAERGHLLLCAADRMLSKGDVTYEPKDLQKVYALGDTGLLLIAGNMVVQSELALAFAQHFGGDNTRTLEEYARTYADLFAKRHARIREQMILGSRSLTMESYLANAARMPDSWSRQIDQELAAFELPETDNIEAIFVGRDSTGAHIFSIQNSSVACHDMVGYAVIGSGGSVADSQFIFAKHSPNTNAPRAVYTLYRAKRMAEQSRVLGVGDESDWYVITSTAKTDRLHTDLLSLLKRLYENERKQEEDRFTKAETQIKADILKRLPKPPPPPTEITASPSTGQQPPSERSGSA